MHLAVVGEPVVGRQRVRADVDDLAVGVQPEQPVAGPRPGVHLARVLRRRERAVGRPSGTGRRRRRRRRSPAGCPPGRPCCWCPARSRAIDLVEVPHRDDLAADPAARRVQRRVLATSPAPPPRRAAAAGSRRARPCRTTRSSTNAVTPVVGRACAAQISRSLSVGTHSSRSENDRSASSCHSETRPAGGRRRSRTARSARRAGRTGSTWRRSVGVRSVGGLGSTVGTTRRCGSAASGDLGDQVALLDEAALGRRRPWRPCRRPRRAPGSPSSSTPGSPGCPRRRRRRPR